MVGEAVRGPPARASAPAGTSPLRVHRRGSTLTLYLDSSALAKLFLDEPGRDLVVEAVEDAGVRASSRLAYVECGAAFARAEREGRTRRGQLSLMLGDLDAAWHDMAVVELDEHIANRAVAIARGRAVRASDAIHLASALAVAPPAGEVTFACFDRRLWDAAGELGLRRLPVEAAAPSET